MPNVNAAPKRFENSGTATITISAAAYIVLNIVPGTLYQKPLQYDRIEYTDRAVPQVPIEGDGTYAEFGFDYLAGKWATGDIYDRIVTAATANTVFVYDSIVFQQPDFRGHTAGYKFTYTSPWCHQYPQYKAEAGNGLDRWSVVFKCNTNFAQATY